MGIMMNTHKIRGYGPHLIVPGLLVQQLTGVVHRVSPGPPGLQGAESFTGTELACRWFLIPCIFLA